MSAISETSNRTNHYTSSMRQILVKNEELRKKLSKMQPITTCLELKIASSDVKSDHALSSKNLSTKGVVVISSDDGDLPSYSIETIKKFNRLVRAVRKGDKKAIYYLGRWFHKGYVPHKSDRLAKLFHEMAKKVQKSNVHVDEETKLSAEQCHLSGMLKVHKDYEKGFMYLACGAIEKNAASMQQIGDFYKQGIGLNESFQLAKLFYLEAAEQGDPDAQYRYALSINEFASKETIKYLTLSAEQGNVKALYALGGKYYNGFGVTRDKERALHYYSEAAIKGHHGAQQCADNIRNGIWK